MTKATRDDPPDARQTDFFVMVPWPIIDLGPHHTQVYAVLRKRADENSSCWPSHKRIASDAGVSVRRVQQVLISLKSAGWIDWDQRKSEGKDFPNTSNIYRVFGTAGRHGVPTGAQEVPTPPRQEMPTGAQEVPTPPRQEMPTGAQEVPSELITTELTTKELESAKPKPATRKKPSTHVPDLFPITDRMREWAATKYPTVDIAEQTERFLDYHRAKGSVMADWIAGWRNWIARAPQFQQKPPTQPVQGTLALAQRLRAQEQQ